jgi:hypothetical protein
VDLLKSFGGGEECVAYARTWVQCYDEQPARLEIGSDDGIKVWLNFRLVDSHNGTRALTPGEDKMDVNLSRGWNELLVKVTQHDQGWGFCARLLKPDGGHIEGLTFDAGHSHAQQP